MEIFRHRELNKFENLEEMDKFMEMNPGALDVMKVYVDDFTATFRFPKDTGPTKAAGCVAYIVRRLHKYLEEELFSFKTVTRWFVLWPTVFFIFI